MDEDNNKTRKEENNEQSFWQTRSFSKNGQRCRVHGNYNFFEVYEVIAIGKLALINCKKMMGAIFLNGCKIRPSKPGH